MGMRPTTTIDVKNFKIPKPGDAEYQPKKETYVPKHPFPQDVTPVSVNDLQIHPNIRTDIDEASIDELAQSIDTVGLLNPILVYAKDGTYFVICGQRRLLAHKKLGIPVVPCIVRKQPTDLEIIFLQAIENDQNESLTGKEREKYINLLKKNGASVEEIAKRMGKSTRWIYACLDASNVREKFGEKFKEKNIDLSTTDTRKLSAASEELVDKALQAIEKNPDDKTKILDEVKKQSTKKPGSQSSKKPKKTGADILSGRDPAPANDDRDFSPKVFSEPFEEQNEEGEKFSGFQALDPAPVTDNFKDIKLKLSIFLDDEIQKFKFRAESLDITFYMELLDTVKAAVHNYFRVKEYI
jgi:ParB family chromosome partitioning protein